MYPERDGRSLPHRRPVLRPAQGRGQHYRAVSSSHLQLYWPASSLLALGIRRLDTCTAQSSTVEPGEEYLARSPSRPYHLPVPGIVSTVKHRRQSNTDLSQTVEGGGLPRGGLQVSTASLPTATSRSEGRPWNSRSRSSQALEI